MATSPRLNLPGSSIEAEFGGTGDGVRSSPVAEATGTSVGASTTGTPTGAPAKAPAAPKGNTKDVFTGLVEALNTQQQRLVDQGKYTYADQYEIIFDPKALAASTLKKQGGTDKTKIGMQNDNSAANQLDRSKQSADLNSRNIQVSAGMQIVQFIDTVMRNSSYITDQQISVYNDSTQQLERNKNNNSGQTAWYKINVQARQLKYDPKRRDHAYKLTYMISPYAINNMQSEYFPTSRYRGSHKSYNYWFTGANKEILNFEQNFNYLYRLIISGTAEKINQTERVDFRGQNQYRKTFVPTSNENAKGADGYTNEPGDNAADFLYSPFDQARIKLKIIGDPGWMQQGEIATGLSSFNFDPFNADGTINFDSQEIVFDISWNRPADYDFNTGIIDVNKKSTVQGQPRENATYVAAKCTSTFSKGRFEQELEGVLMVEPNQGTQAASAAARPKSNSPDSQTGNNTFGNTRPGGTINPSDGNWIEQNGMMVLRDDITPDNEGRQSDSNLEPLPSPAATPPTSTGDIQLTDVEALSANYSVPPKIGTLRLNNGRVADFFESERGAFERALASGATPVSSPPQNIAREA
jgi:hypothetical protein